MEEKVETKQLEKELEAKVGDLVGRFSEPQKVKISLKSFFLENVLKTDEVINNMKDSIKRNLDAQLEIQRKTRQTLQGKILHF